MTMRFHCEERDGMEQFEPMPYEGAFQAEPFFAPTPHLFSAFTCLMRKHHHTYPRDPPIVETWRGRERMKKKTGRMLREKGTGGD